MFKHFKSLEEIERYFDYGWRCREYIESLRWKDGLFSPYTGSKNVRQIGYYDTYICLDTGRSFSTLTGTIFANSKVKLLHWFQVIWLNWLHPEMSSAEISRQIGINQKTVWNMLKKINSAQKPIKHDKK